MIPFEALEERTAHYQREAAKVRQIAQAIAERCCQPLLNAIGCWFINRSYKRAVCR